MAEKKQRKKPAERKAKGLREYLKLTERKIFEVVVFSTMSSGKSTLINALIGKELLPARNEACTSRTISIWDNDKAENTTLHIERGAGNRSAFPQCGKEKVAEVTSTDAETITDIVLETNIQGIRNIKKSLVIVDTPGVNNYFDATHIEATREYLDTHTADLLLYIINAAQIGTNDDKAALEMLKESCKKMPEAQVLFVMNKADCLDDERVPIEETIEYCERYLEANGFEDARIVLTSAAAALIFKKVMQGEKLTKSELQNFRMSYEMFAPAAANLAAFGEYRYPNQKTMVTTQDGRQYRWADLVSALENTGLPLAERAIEDCLLKRIGGKR